LKKPKEQVLPNQFEGFLMDIELDFEKSLEENASSYFEKSKAAKKKLSGLKKAMIDLEKKASKVKEKPKAKPLAVKRKRQWFEAFHWFTSSQGFLVIGGRDAKSNEAVVKKHLDKEDMFLHADIQGGSACVVKSEGKKIPEQSLKEAAEFAAVWSKAWQQKLASVDVYAASKEQVSKKAPSGEAISTGGFMIYGKRQWFRKTTLQFAVGLLKEGDAFTAMGGPPEAVKKNCIAFVKIVQGKEKKSGIAKKVLQRFEKKTGKTTVSLNDLISLLPGDLLEIREEF